MCKLTTYHCSKCSIKRILFNVIKYKPGSFAAIEFQTLVLVKYSEIVINYKHWVHRSMRRMRLPFFIVPLCHMTSHCKHCNIDYHYSWFFPFCYCYLWHVSMIHRSKFQDKLTVVPISRSRIHFCVIKKIFARICDHIQLKIRFFEQNRNATTKSENITHSYRKLL